MEKNYKIQRRQHKQIKEKEENGFYYFADDRQREDEGFKDYLDNYWGGTDEE